MRGREMAEERSVCSVCGEAFGSREELERHTREQHPEIAGGPDGNTPAGRTAGART
jgi:hypothetical protein